MAVDQLEKRVSWLVSIPANTESLMSAVVEELPIRPTSLTHQHLFSVLHTRLRRARVDRDGPHGRRRLRVLDIGCGDGLFIDFLQTHLEHYYPECDVEVFGFDVSEVGYHDQNQLPNALSLLQTRHPEVPWSERITSQAAGVDWGFPARFFDIAVSNQVLEHVDDLDHFLRNLKRCLKQNGFSAHLFPLANHVVEAHTKMPFVHYIQDQESRTAYANWLNRVGVSRYRLDREILGYKDTHTHAEDAAKFIQAFTCYRKFGDFYRECNQLGMSVSHHYTKDLYLAKLRRLCRLRPVLTYRPWNWLLLESILSGALKYVSSVTLTIAPINYDIGQRVRSEKEFCHRSRTRADKFNKQAA